MTDTTLAQSVWPLNGYAPGGYTCVCCTCEKHFDGDKRATTCLECAIARLRDANKALTAERDEADNALVDKYRDPKTGTFSFPGDVAAIVRRLEAAEAKLAETRKREELARNIIREFRYATMSGSQLRAYHALCEALSPSPQPEAKEALE